MGEKEKKIKNGGRSEKGRRACGRQEWVLGREKKMKNNREEEKKKGKKNIIK